MTTQIESKNIEATKNNQCKLGSFKVQMKNSDNQMLESNVVLPLEQKDYVDGWRQVLPCKKKDSQISHFQITLDKLPPHLWDKVKHEINDNKYYAKIRDKIHEYTIKKTDHDSLIFELYDLLKQQSPNIEQVKEVHRKLQEATFKGSWVMIKADQMIKADNMIKQ
jgi:hypothetical protein